MQTTNEFNGGLAPLIVALLLCLPVGIYYYFSRKEEMRVCPHCRETADIHANTCPNCRKDL